MTKEELENFVKDLKGENYKLMEIQPIAAKKVNRYRNLLFYVNVPLMIGIPAFIESGIFLSYYEHKVQQITTLLTVADFFFVLDSLLIYSLIGKIVTSINYNS